MARNAYQPAAECSTRRRGAATGRVSEAAWRRHACEIAQRDAWSGFPLGLGGPLSGRVLREIAAVVRVAIAEERAVVAVEHDTEHRRGIELVERGFEQLARRLVR